MRANLNAIDDAAIADSQGLIADRAWELLGQTDLGLVSFRRLMFEAIDRMDKGMKPRGVDNPEAYRVRSGDAMSEPNAKGLDVASDRFGIPAGRSLRNMSTQAAD